ncbi:putative baseplate assembly protein [Streptomyces palmae]|uniref:Putative baseplate assembly protein n=1 Tax=Streptomyces palmae TaxID=1701085 RepID=A0A4Z0HD41_9ACTN|nr:putative baseplate assembly protein [Streptomyces palmae]TGB10024.1 putative baseplate assembly protein [Streptomyces palmae]
MSLPTPDYDHRSREDLLHAAVDAVRDYDSVMQAWPGRDRTDPGRALLETCVDMAAVLADRLNRAADRHRLDLLSRLGPKPYPAVAARGEVVFTLAAPVPEPVRINAGVEVATRPPTDDEDPVVFSTVTDVVLNPCVLVIAGNFTGAYRDGQVRGTLTRFDKPGVSAVEPGGLPFAGPPFHLNLPYTGDFPLTDTAMPPRSAWAREQPVEEAYSLVVLSNPVPDVRLTLDVAAEKAPTAWQAWAGTRWEPCRVIAAAERPEGTHRVTIDLTSVHAPADLLLDPTSGTADSRPWRLRDVGLLRSDSAKGRISSVALEPLLTVTAPVVQAHRVTDEDLGIAVGEPGERHHLSSRPLLLRSADALAVTAASADGQELTWRYVESLAESEPGDRHFTFHPRTGEAVFAPVVPEGRGARRYGAPLPAGARLRVPHYLTGGGARGNAHARTITALRTPVPYVSAVNNPGPATGGTDQETPGQYAVRRPLGSTVPERAVTGADYKQLALAASASMARIHHVPTEAANLLNPARNIRDWKPATTTVRFVVADTGVTVKTQTQLYTTGDPRNIAFLTTKEAPALVSPAELGSLRLRRLEDGPGGMFTGKTWRGTGPLPGDDTISTGADGSPLLMALVRVPPDMPPLKHLNLCVTRSPSLGGRRRLAVSVFLPRSAYPWWDTDNPCCYSARWEDTDGGVAGHRVELRRSRDWQMAVDPANKAYATTLYEALGEQPAGFPSGSAGAWLAVQIRDPEGPRGDVSYTVALTGVSVEVPAVQRQIWEAPTKTYTKESAQHFDLLAPGGVEREFPTLQVKEPGSGWVDWQWVDDFRESKDDSRHAVLNASTGRVHFGPVTPDPSRSGTQHGKVPAEGSEVRVDRSYTVTRGAKGNQVKAGTPGQPESNMGGAISAWITSDATGGVDGYTDASGGSTEFGVQLLVVPRVAPDHRGWFPYQDLMPTPDACQAVRQALAPRQPADVPVWLRPPGYRGIRITATVAPADFPTAAEREELRAAAERALYTYFSPVTGGPDGTGWPLGRPVHAGEAFRVLDRVPGIGRIHEVRLVPADPQTGGPQPAEEPIVCSPTETVYSVEHHVTVTETP